MSSSNKSVENSFFGGPLSTRKTCRAAVKRRQRVDDSSQRQESSTSTPPLSFNKREAKKKQIMHSRNETAVPRQRVRQLITTVKDRHLAKAAPQAQPRRPIATGKNVDRLKRTQMQRTTKLPSRIGQREERSKRVALSAGKRPLATQLKATGVKRKKVRSGEDGEVKVQRDRHLGRDPHESFAVQRRHTTQIRLRQPLPKRRPVPTVVPDEMADFIVDDGEDEQDDMDWHAELKRTTNYDPSKFHDDYDLDDRCMESSFRQCLKEERRSHVIGKLEDQRELERERKRKIHRQ